VVRELKVLGVIGKNGKEGFPAQPAVKLDAQWNLEILRAVVFVEKNRAGRFWEPPRLR
jgi:hypothetical protein